MRTIGKNVVVLAGVAALALSSGVNARGPVGAVRHCVVPTPARVEAQFALFNAAWATRDADQVADLFAEDAVLLPTLSPVPRTDRAGIRDYFVGFLKGSPQARIDSSKIYASCNLAARVGQWTVTLKDADTGASRDVHARYSFLYSYRHGHWQIAHLHSSLDPQGH